MTRRRTIQLTSFVVVTGLFIAGANLLYNFSMLTWNKAQLEDLAARSIIRAELASDLAVTTIAEIQSRGLTDCSSETLAAFRSYIYSVGRIKDIRLKVGPKSCAVFKHGKNYAETLSGATWNKGLNSSVHFAVLNEEEGQSLGILWKSSDYDVVTVVSTGGLLYDMVPLALRPYLGIKILVNSGSEIAAYHPDEETGKKVSTYGLNDPMKFTASSSRYPIKSVLTIDRSVLWAWGSPGLMSIEILVCLAGLLVGLLASRALFPPLGPIEEIDQAILKGEFHPFFQPIVSLKTSEVVGFEMLARWTQPDGKQISPARFIPLAENFGRIDTLLFSLLRSAGREVGEQLLDHPRLKMTFNVTPGQFLDKAFLPRLLEVIEEAHLPVRNLVVEITERQELVDLETAGEVIRKYKKAGIRIAIDDAGTGHNGLSCIQTLDVDTLKLDKLFIDGIVENERSRQMIEMLSNLARQYRMIVVAEGVETLAQARMAHGLGIQQGQGYFFSPPVNATKLITLIESKHLYQDNDLDNIVAIA